MNIIELLNSSIWAINPRIAVGYLPHLLQFGKGDLSVFAQKQHAYVPERMAIASLSASAISSENAPSQFVMRYKISGMMTKEDQECGPRGLKSVIAQMLEFDKNDDVVAHFLTMSTGGGQAAYIVEAMDKIRYEVKKPVVGFIDDMCASAGLIVIACDEVYVNSPTALTGSAGVMMTIHDFRLMLEKAGIKEIQVFAAQSSEKTEEFLKAFEGDTELLQEIWLNPKAEEFIAKLQEMRPETVAFAEQIYKGRTLTAAQAIEYKLIDGIKKEEDALARCVELGLDYKSKNSKNSKKNSGSMAETNFFAKLFGTGVAAEADGTVKLNAEQVAKIEAALAESTNTLAKVTETLGLADERNKQAEANLKDLVDRVAALEGVPATKPANAGDAGKQSAQGEGEDPKTAARAELNKLFVKQHSSR